MQVNPIVALIGIDGSGKTTLLEQLQQIPTLAGFAFVKKRKRYAVNSIIEVDRHSTALDYLHGAFAEGVRWAHAFDFLRFYEEEVIPALDRNKVVVSDRWSICSVAYSCVGPKLHNEIAHILRCVRAADLLIYLDVEPAEAIRRIAEARPLEGDESLELLTAFREGYERVLPQVASKVLRVPTHDRSAVLDTVKRHLESLRINETSLKT